MSTNSSEEKNQNDDREDKSLQSSSDNDELVSNLRQLNEEVGQISELNSEENNLVQAFSLAFFRLMESFTDMCTVDVSIIPPGMGEIEKANIIPKGDLMILFKDGKMESIDLKKENNRDLLLIIVSNVIPKFKSLISERRNKIEKRIAFLSEITKELQNIADSI